MDNARGFVLHTSDWTGEGSLRVNEGLALTASLDVLKAIAEGGGPREGILALGYAGWGPGQLDAEIQQNAWLSVPGRRDDRVRRRQRHQMAPCVRQAEHRSAAVVRCRRPLQPTH